MQLSVAEAARIVSGTVAGAPDVQLTGAEVDSRRVRQGDLFVALRGARSDGHVFVTDALSVAAAALVRYDAEFDSIPSDRALIRVPDPLAAYWELARYERGAAIGGLPPSPGRWARPPPRTCWRPSSNRLSRSAPPRGTETPPSVCRQRFSRSRRASMSLSPKPG